MLQNFKKNTKISCIPDPQKKSGATTAPDDRMIYLLKMCVTGLLLLDHTIGVDGPDLIIGILEIFETSSKLRLFSGLGGGAGLLDSTGSIHQILYSVKLHRCVAQVAVSIQAQAVAVDTVVTDTVETMTLVAAVG